MRFSAIVLYRERLDSSVSYFSLSTIFIGCQHHSNISVTVFICNIERDLRQALKIVSASPFTRIRMYNRMGFSLARENVRDPCGAWGIMVAV